MFVPEGMTEQETIDIIYRACRKAARKYCFGYHDMDDIVQEAAMFCVTTLDKGKFKPRGDKPMAQQLYCFLRVWARNRQSNYRRDHSCRYGNPTSQLNINKYNIMHPLKIHSQGLTQHNMFARYSNLDEDFDAEDIQRRILEGLTVVQRKNYFKLLSGVIILPEYEQELYDRISEILQIQRTDVLTDETEEGDGDNEETEY